MEILESLKQKFRDWAFPKSPRKKFHEGRQPLRKLGKPVILTSQTEEIVTLEVGADRKYRFVHDTRDENRVYCEVSFKNDRGKWKNSDGPFFCALDFDPEKPKQGTFSELVTHIIDCIENPPNLDKLREKKGDLAFCP